MTASAANRAAAAQEVTVWDPFVRIGHWLIVAGFFTAYFIVGREGTLLLIHTWGGYVVGAVLALRVLWGFIGTTHARFRSFVYSRFAVLPYLAGLLQRKSPRYLGHSPAGTAMVFTLMFGIAATGFTGLWAYAQTQGTGPLSSWVQQVERPAVTAPPGATGAPAGQGFRRPAPTLVQEAHQLIGDVTFWLTLLHIGGVLLASWAHRENLIKAMFTGRKRAEAG